MRTVGWIAGLVGARVTRREVEGRSRRRREREAVLSCEQERIGGPPLGLAAEGPTVRDTMQGRVAGSVFERHFETDVAAVAARTRQAGAGRGCGGALGGIVFHPDMGGHAVGGLDVERGLDVGVVVAVRVEIAVLEDEQQVVSGHRLGRTQARDRRRVPGRRAGRVNRNSNVACSSRIAVHRRLTLGRGP